MAHDTHSSATPPEVSPEMLAQHRATWHWFTRGMFLNSVATAVVLIFLLLVAKVF